MENNISKEIIFYKEEEIYTLEELLKQINNLKIDVIQISKDTLMNRDGKTVKFLETDYDNHYRIKKEWDDSYNLLINEEYYLQNREEVNKLIEEICNKTTEKEITISDNCLITSNILKLLANNQNLEKVTLTSKYEKNPNKQFILTKEIYKLFKESSNIKSISTPAISEELQENFDSLIEYNIKRYLIGTDNYSNLQDENYSLSIRNNLKEEEINNLEYICDNKKIRISIDDYNNVSKILDKLISLNKNVDIEINVNEKEKFNQSTIYINSDKYKSLNIKINSNLKTLKLDDYKRFENIIYSFLKPIENKNYSPLEKFLYAYNITKRFKKYKEVPKERDKMDSRNIYDILFNDYMVCAGYANMLQDLLTKLGISAIEKSVMVGVHEEERYYAGHARVFVNLIDEKYGINGIYTSDPTWDNDLIEDYYNHSLMTTEEVNVENLKFGGLLKDSYSTTVIDKVLLIESITLDEFYKKINIIINKHINNYFKDNNKKVSSEEIKEDTNNFYKHITKDLLNFIKEIDIEKYNELINKYKEYINITKYDKNYNEIIKKSFSNIIEELGDYFVSKMNNKVNGKTIIDAAMVINKDIFSLTKEQEDELRTHLIDVNKERQQYYFPKRKIENVRTGEINYENEDNKFDLKEIEQKSGKVK